MKVSRLLWGGLWLLFSPFDQAPAIVFFSQGNDANLSSPAGLNLPWDNVVQMRSTSGPIGSGVYLGIALKKVNPTSDYRGVLAACCEHGPSRRV